MIAWYNEIDSFAAEWLRELARNGHIAEGKVDDRSILQVAPDDIGHGQAHFFAGIGAWSYALRLAGWPDDLPVWTGSCPCQPFSVAGKRRGVGDSRHLWPVWRALIAECRPPIVFGEQVASPAGRGWLSDVRADLEALGYAVGAADLCAAGVGAPHVRQRLFWGAVRVENTDRERREGERVQLRPWQEGPALPEASWRSTSSGGRLGDSHGESARRIVAGPPAEKAGHASPRHSAGGVGDSAGSPGTGGSGRLGDSDGTGPQRSWHGWPTAYTDPWADPIWIDCADGKRRPAKPSIQPVAHGATARMGRLRAYGNAIVPQVAAAFIRSFVEAINGD